MILFRFFCCLPFGALDRLAASWMMRIGGCGCGCDGGGVMVVGVDGDGFQVIVCWLLEMMVIEDA